jgi:hypothetical protein
MKRSAGVTTAAVVALIGSVFAVLFGVLWLFGIFLLSRGHNLASSTPHQMPPPLTLTEFMLMSLLSFGFGGWGLSTSTGLFKVKPWSRVSILIFSSVIAVLTISVIPVLWFLSLPKMPGTAVVSSSAYHMTLVIIFGVPLGIVMWWLVFFSRSSTGEQFPGTSIATERPIGITVIAWLSIIFSLFNLLIILITTKSPWAAPEPFFLTIILGRAAQTYRRFFLPFSFLAGAGLLWNRVWGFWLAVTLDVFYLLNRGMFFAFPHQQERWGRYLALALASRPPERIPGSYRVVLIWISAIGIIEVTLFLLVLILGKTQYLAVATRRENVTSAAS